MGISAPAGASAADISGRQPLDADLTAVAAEATTAYGISVLSRVNAAALRTLAGVVIGTDVVAQADARFTTIVPNRQTASYTLALTDVTKVVEMNVASSNTLTFPPNTDVAIPINSVGEWAQYGAGQVTLTPGSGVTVRSSGNKYKSTAQYSQGSWRKVGTDEFIVGGDLSA